MSSTTAAPARAATRPDPRPVRWRARRAAPHRRPRVRRRDGCSSSAATSRTRRTPRPWPVRGIVLDGPGRGRGRGAAPRARSTGSTTPIPSEVVNVHIPAIHGRYVGFPGFIEVEIESTRPSIFGGIIGRAPGPIGAIAVATNEPEPDVPVLDAGARTRPSARRSRSPAAAIVEAYANIQSNSNGCGLRCRRTAVGFSRTGGARSTSSPPDATCRVVGEHPGLRVAAADHLRQCAENSFALPDPLRNLAGPADARRLRRRWSSRPHERHRHSGELPGRSPAPTRDPDPELRCRRERRAYRDLSWILSPGPVPGGLEVCKDAHGLPACPASTGSAAVGSMSAAADRS